MKTLYSFLATGLICTSLHAQKISKDKVPSVITQFFQQEFPKASDVEWKKKDSLYEVEFESGPSKKDHTIQFNTKGKIVCHEEGLSIDDLPPAVLKQVRSQFPGFRIED